jgi:deoxyribodipyrimidine photo-lyase
MGEPIETAVVLFTRDLRVNDNPALAYACEHARKVLPLFVLDPRVPSSPVRDRFLAESLAELRCSLRNLGGGLVLRHGDPVGETMRVAAAVGADTIALARDASGYATRREQRLRAAAGRMRVAVLPGPGVVDLGQVVPVNGTHYKVFTPYWRAWSAARRRDVLPMPAQVRLPERVPDSVPLAAASRHGAVGGEAAGRRRVSEWLPILSEYGLQRDFLAGEVSSRLSAYLHFGCVSPVELASAVDGRAGAQPFLRQLCWRDFYQQVLYAFPEMPTKVYRSTAAERWTSDDDAIEAWRHGRTGVPIVDAGMRQLATDGFMPNRARLITAAYLTKQLGIDWRAGGEWFMQRLLDADVANNYGNWQWVAGTGNDTRVYRRFNPIRQAERFDPDGAYVRRHVPELVGLPDNVVHEPWKLDGVSRSALRYPDRIAA